MRTRDTKRGLPERTRRPTTRQPPAMPNKPSTSPTRPGGRPTDPEPAFSTRPTMRDLTPLPPLEVNARGQYSISAAHGIPIDVVAGTIDRGPAGRKRGSTGPSYQVRVTATGPRQLTLEVGVQVMTIDRSSARALAEALRKVLDER